MKKQVLVMDEKDNVGIVLQDMEQGEVAVMKGQELPIQIKEAIPRSHKVAIRNINEKEPILRYGEPIGYATRPIFKGEWVHVHNLDAYEIM